MDIPDWGWCPWWHFWWSAYAMRKLCLKFGWNMMSLKASKMDAIARVVAGVYDDYGHSWQGLVSLMTFCIVCKCREETNFKILKASRSPSKIDYIAAIVARDYDDDYGHSWPGLVSLITIWMVCICPEGAEYEFGWNLLSLEASRSPSKIDDIVAVVAGVYDDHGHSWLQHVLDILDVLHMPWVS